MSKTDKMLQLVKHFYRDQRGAFAVSFVILAGALLSLAALGIEGSRYIRERARFSDALEQAALALVSEDNGQGSARNTMLTNAWVGAYLPGSKTLEEPVIRVSKGIDPTRDQLSYVEYRVSSKVASNSWMSSSLFPSFNPEVVLGNNGAARKYRTAMDVMFVADFSVSMKYSFSGGGGSKFENLQRAIMSISSEVLKDNKQNKVGFVPFSWGTRSDDGTYCNPQFASNRPVPSDVYSTPSPQGRAWAANVYHYVDIQATYDRFPEPMDDFHIPYSNIIGFGRCLKDAINPRPVLLTSSIDDIAAINTMGPEGNTLVSAGMLQGGRLLYNGTAARKILVIISDGTDFPITGPDPENEDIDISKKLINLGLCNKIRDVLTTTDANGNQIIGKIAFIGVDYLPTLDWKACVGENNYYEVNNADAFSEAMRHAVFEEVGHSTVKDE